MSDRGAASLRLENIVRGFPTAHADPELNVLRGAKLDIEPGERIVISGDNGSGKSTMLRILGLLDDEYSGRYLLSEQDVPRDGAVALDARRRREQVGFIHQRIRLLPYLSLKQNLDLVFFFCDLTPEQRTARVEWALEATGLREKRNQRVSVLSGGERQLAGIARALVMRPRLLLADEPTSSLDRGRQAIALDLIEHAQRVEPMTCVAVSHQPEILQARGYRHIRLQAGLCQEVS